MKINRYFERIKLSPASLDGQGIAAAPKAYFAKQSMERVRRGTAKSPVFAAGKNGPKEIKVKGKIIKLNGSKGVSTEGKQLAVQDDKVMGFDVHIMVVPSGPSTTTVPLPHPFIGKINDKVSEDVKIKDKGVAVKGSKAKHDDSMHMQLPGTIQFQNSPKCEGEVTGGTGTKVKVNGKEVAVIGSQVTTCNDTGLQNNSTIIAAGASIPMPVIINPLKAEEFEREREGEEEKEPKFSEVKWSTTSVEEGEEVELTASVKDIEDGNMVTLQVFPEGKGPEDSIPMASFPLTVQGGSVSAKWSYKSRDSEVPPEENPKFVFSAHCAWCNFEKSSNSVEVKFIRPEITKAEWQNKDGVSVTKGLVGEPLKLVAETKHMEGGVTFVILDDKKRQLATLGTDIEGDKAEAEWNPVDVRLPGNTDALKYTFEVKSSRCKKAESSEIQIKNPKVLSMEWDKNAVMWGEDVELKITTFEMADESPEATVEIWEEERESPKKLLLSTDITLDKEENSLKLKLELPLNDMSKFDTDDDYRVYATVRIEKWGKYFKQDEENYLLISDDF